VDKAPAWRLRAHPVPSSKQSWWATTGAAGRRGLERNREELCECSAHLDAQLAGACQAFPASAPSLHNPDFVDVVIHSYRHRYGLVDGDPRYQRFGDLIAEEPRITVPTVVLESGEDGVGGPAAKAGRDYFTAPYNQSVFPGIGHKVPQEDPSVFAQAVVSLFG
jgi:pimeloyl-ACP methyl ester carboxylesterase